MPGPVRVYLIPALVDPAALAGGIAIVIDQLRASTVICAALAAGAQRVTPFLEPDEAGALKASLQPGTCLTGGEREGTLIEGFDLANSPQDYTPARVGGKVIAFTTTNGTKAAILSEQADELLIGCLANLGAICTRIGPDARTVHIVCAGTRDRVTLEDVLAAGAIAERLVTFGHPVNLADPRPDDDQSLIAQTIWRDARSRDGGILDALKRSRGGRNLARIGLQADVEACSRVDATPVVPRFDRGSRSFVL